MDVNNIRVGITQGDINGIGYEIVLKTLSDHRVFEKKTIVIYGSPKVAAYHKKALEIEGAVLNLVKSAKEANPKKANIIDCNDNSVKVELGQETEHGGVAAYEALKRAVEDLKAGEIDVLVTAPINKHNIQSEEFNFPGHTEYLSNAFDAKNTLMFLVSEKMKVGVVTGHVPISEVSSEISKEKILLKLNVMNESLKEDFTIRKPRIAVLGLNPHAGDNGIIGNEEKTIIAPAIEEANERGILAFGPYAADGFFAAQEHSKFDAILAMYHDQGLIPFKSLVFGQGVNFTAGLPVVRTSPDHGTAYQLAGKNEASEQSFREALFLAVDIAKARQMNQKLKSNQLKPQVTEDE